MERTHFTEEHLLELQELQRHFCTDWKESTRLFRLIGLQLLAATDKAECVDDIRREAEIILNYFKGVY